MNKYNNEILFKYCIDNNIILIKDYSITKINRNCYIEGKCKTTECDKLFNKSFRQLVKTEAYCNVCSYKNGINKIKELKVKFDLTMLKQVCDDKNILLIDDYSNIFVNRDTIIKGICLTTVCKNIFEKPFRQLLKIGGYCKNCSKENGKIKIKETTFSHYGVDCALKSQVIRDKSNVTHLLKYGVIHNSQLDKIKQQKKDKSIEKYGVEYPLQSHEIREQIKKTNIEKYGVENPQQNQEIKEKVIQTNIEKYGANCYFQTEEFKNKSIETNLEKYGVVHHSQNSNIADKMLKGSYNKKQYSLPSGNVINYQGYENFAFDELLNIEKINETDIVVNRKDVPTIWYNDKNGKKHRHYVDFYIKSQNRCVEVKSTWTINQDKNNVFEKQTAAIDLGYKYDIWIFNNKGNKINSY